MNEQVIPPGTPVRVRQQIDHRMKPMETEIVGVVEAVEDLPTGSWYAHGKPAGSDRTYGRLWLKRLTLRKLDGEITTLVIDNATEIAKLEPASPDQA